MGFRTVDIILFWSSSLNSFDKACPPKAYDVGQAVEFYEKVEGLEVKGHLRDQLLRAAASIPLNLSEGNAKPSPKEKKRFYQTAYASIQECKTIFKLLKLEDDEVVDFADKLGAYTFKLLRSDLKVNQFRDS